MKGLPYKLSEHITNTYTHLSLLQSELLQVSDFEDPETEETILGLVSVIDSVISTLGYLQSTIEIHKDAMQ